MKYRADVVRIRENYIILNGQAIGRDPGGEATFPVEDETYHALPFKLVGTRWDDVSQIYYHQTSEKEYGSDIRFPHKRGKIYYLITSVEGYKARIKYNEGPTVKRPSIAHKCMKKVKDLYNVETVRVTLDYFRKHGLKKLFLKSKDGLRGIDSDHEYVERYEKTRPTEVELQCQRGMVFDGTALLFLIVIPLFETPTVYLKAFPDSLLAQTYAKSKVCLVDGSRPGRDIEAALRDYAVRDPKIHYMVLGESHDITGNTSATLVLAAGNPAMLCDHNNTPLPEAFFFFAEAVVKGPETDCPYSDEDKLDMDGDPLFDPHLKPDFNPDLLGSANHICCLFVVWENLLDTVEQLDAAYDSTQNHGSIFRVTEKAWHMVHVPRVLYH